MRINQDSDHLIHVNISSYQLYMIYPHLLTVTHLVMSGVFLDISKAFDRVWHEGLIYKIKSIGVTGLPLELIQSFLSHRFQRVVLIGQSLTWLAVTAGVPQWSILGPLFFLIYINDLSNNLSSTAKLFADDTFFFF